MAQSSLHADLERFRRAEPKLAVRLVRPGNTGLLVHALGSPAWAFRATSLRADDRIPSRISLIDDMRIWANLTEQIGEREIYRMLCSLPRMTSSASSSWIFAAPSMGDAIELLIRLANAINPQQRFWLERQGELAAVRVFSSPALGKISSVLEIASQIFMGRMLQMILGFEVSDPDGGSKIVFQSPHDSARFGKELADLVQFEIDPEPRPSAISLSADMLPLPSPTYNALRWAEGLSEARRIEDESRRHSITFVVKAIITESIVREGRVPGVDEVARALALSERTLSRMMAAEGQTFRQAVAKTRGEFAKQFLALDHLTIGEVARLVGFSDSSNFVRSFTSWFGRTPGAWREANRAKPDSLA